jgi:protease I
MSLHGKRAIVFVEANYQDLEFWYPVLRLREEGVEVVIVGTGSADGYTGRHGYPLPKVDAVADNVSAKDFDVVIVPGGWAPDVLRRYESVLKIVRDAFAQNKVVGAICHAGSVLVSANVLRGKTVTCVPAIKDDLINAGATYVDREVVRDGKLITSRTPGDLPAFMREIIKVMNEK